MLLLHTIKVPFINSIPKDDIPTPYINCPSAPPYEQIPIDPLTKNPLPHNSPLIDKTPIDVTVSTDGKIAVMYKRGGIIIYKPIKVYSVGIFELLPVSYFILLTILFILLLNIIIIIIINNFFIDFLF